MSQEKIESMINVLRAERYRWKPVRRVYIEKKHSTKKRPLGIPIWSDKLLQEVIRLILEAYYEPQFSRYSHGFRPNRGCHTALREIYYRWVGTKWFVEGDIAQCFDTLDHTVLMSILREKIHDNRFLRLIENLLRAGYLEEWRYHATVSGSPQGAVLSPILSNLYLDKLDQFIERTLLPKYNRGTRRRTNSAWARLQRQTKTLAMLGRREDARLSRRQMQQVSSLDPHDPGYRRLRYVRYADDWLLGFSGPQCETEAITRDIGTFLREHLHLELSEPKTLITHARTETARFLGYDIAVLYNDRKLDRRGHRSINGQIGLRVPKDVIKSKCLRYRRHGQPIHRAELIHDTAFSIVAQYQQEYRGLVEYYRLAYNVHQLNRRTSRTQRRTSLKCVTEWGTTNRHQRRGVLGARLNAKLRGYDNYDGVHGNFASLKQFFFSAMGILQKWLNRRSQRRRDTWAVYQERLARVKVERPRMVGRPKPRLAASRVSARLRTCVCLKRPVREHRTPGSVRGPSGHWRSYRDGDSLGIYTGAGRTPEAAVI